MVIDNQLLVILNAVIRDPQITSQKLEEKFNLSRKQLSYRIEKINNYLGSHELEPIERTRNGHLNVDKKVLDFFHTDIPYEIENSYVFSEIERSYYILFQLLSRSEKLKLIHLSSTLSVSQNTVLSDLKKIKKITDAYDVEICYDRANGYHISGDEINKRYLLLDVLRKCLSMNVSTVFSDSNKVSEYWASTFNVIINEVEKELKILFTDQQLQEIAVYMSYVMQRVEQGKSLDALPDWFVDLKNTRDYEIISQILKDHKISNKNEQLFFTAVVKGTNIHTFTDKNFNLDEKLLDSVVSVVGVFEQQCCISFKDKNELVEKIYQHWKPAYYRIRYNFTNSSSVYSLLAEELSYLHSIVSRCVEPFENMLEREIPDEEIAFLTVIFGGWLTREGLLHQIKTKKTAVVVSTKHTTVSTWVFMTLQVLLPEIYFKCILSKREYGKFNQEHDLVFSETVIHTNKSFFKINLPLDTFQKKTLRNQVMDDLQGISSNSIRVDELVTLFARYGEIKQKKELIEALNSYIYGVPPSSSGVSAESSDTPSLGELLTLPYIEFSGDKFAKWEHLISRAAEPLIKNEVISERYISAIVEKIKADQPYILLAEGIMIAHAGIDDGVNEIGLSLLRLSHKEKINDYMDVDIVITLATNDTKNHLKALTQLNDFLEFHNGAALIRNSESETELASVFKNYM
ncbi:BglG family transcription antiterminator [Klebsiella quasipneumoniae]|uniref:BglG family transcription antiterminator n=1 Tax=Klebsiella quasipneumoniae TaxID=1463165 RepID=UPI000CEC851F|nr:PRD domain-containing protein [Klebsiella quasipneumoniae]ROC60478.1 PRD domain-containing protein [Klebsiella quasipneumoniae subsp. quasipneumoniae]